MRCIHGAGSGHEVRKARVCWGIARRAIRFDDDQAGREKAGETLIDDPLAGAQPVDQIVGCMAALWAAFEVQEQLERPDRTKGVAQESLYFGCLGHAASLGVEA